MLVLQVAANRKGFVFVDPDGDEHAATTPEEVWELLQDLVSQPVPQSQALARVQPRQRTTAARVQDDPPAGDEYEPELGARAQTAEDMKSGNFLGRTIARGAVAGLEHAGKLSNNSRITRGGRLRRGR